MMPQEELTLDQDATFIETETSGALYNYYKGKRSYEVLNAVRFFKDSSCLPPYLA